MSRVGPQKRLWQRAGVAKMTATGLPAPITRSSDTAWSGQAGWRVQIGLTPSASVVVGDGAWGAGWPGAGSAGVAAPPKARLDTRAPFGGRGGPPIPRLSKGPGR